MIFNKWMCKTWLHSLQFENTHNAVILYLKLPYLLTVLNHQVVSNNHNSEILALNLKLDRKRTKGDVFFLHHFIMDRPTDNFSSQPTNIEPPYQQGRIVYLSLLLRELLSVKIKYNKQIKMTLIFGFLSCFISL